MATYLAPWQIDQIAGPAVAIDVVRAFTTAAYAFGAGATLVHLVSELHEVDALLDAHPEWLAMGENRGLRPERFALSNSPVHAAQADLEGRVLVQRTSAGTRGALAAASAQPLLCASLVVASATAAYLHRVAPGVSPTYVITGRFADAPHTSGDEDLAAAQHIESRRAEFSGSVARHAVSAAAASQRVIDSPDATHTLTLGEPHVHPDDIAYCVDVDRFDFAMVATRSAHGLTLRQARP